MFALFKVGFWVWQVCYFDSAFRFSLPVWGWGFLFCCLFWFCSSDGCWLLQGRVFCEFAILGISGLRFLTNLVFVFDFVYICLGINFGVWCFGVC